MKSMSIPTIRFLKIAIVMHSLDSVQNTCILSVARLWCSKPLSLDKGSVLFHSTPDLSAQNDFQLRSVTNCEIIIGCKILPRLGDKMQANSLAQSRKIHQLLGFSQNKSIKPVLLSNR